MVRVQGVAKRWEVTERDERWLAWLGRWKGATAPQVSEEFTGRGESAPLKVVERRLRGMREIGLLESRRMVNDLPSAWSLTQEGMRKAGIGGRSLPPTLSDFRHDIGVITIARKVAVDKPHHRIITEREIRRLETPGRQKPTNPKYCIRAIVGGKVKWVFPDLVSVTPGGQTWAHELEASPKDRRRLAGLMLAYIYADHITGVRYYAVPDVAAGVKELAAEANANAAQLGRPQKISVQDWPAITASSATNPSSGRAHTPEDAYSE